MSKNIKPFYMHESGSIPGVPNPDSPSGLWPGGMTVYIDLDTNEVVDTSLIGSSQQPLPGEVQPASSEAQPEPEDLPAQDPNETVYEAAVEQRIAG